QTKSEDPVIVEYANVNSASESSSEGDSSSTDKKDDSFVHLSDDSESHGLAAVGNSIIIGANKASDMERDQRLADIRKSMSDFLSQAMADPEDDTPQSPKDLPSPHLAEFHEDDTPQT